MMMNNSSNNNITIPLFFNLRDEEQVATKLSEDSYDVFVNGMYVGEKTLYAQNEDFHAVGDFLEQQGFNNVEVELNGDHIVVHADTRDEAERMRQALEVYLNNR